MSTRGTDTKTRERSGGEASGPATLSADDRRLRALLIDVLLIEEDEYRDAHGPEEIGAWDSLATVTIAGEVEREFGYAMEPEEMVALRSIGDIKELLRAKGAAFQG